MPDEKYTVIPVNRYALPVGPSETVSKKDIPAAKKRIKEKLGRDRQKFDVFPQSQTNARSTQPKAAKAAKKPATFKSTPNRSTYKVTPVNKYDQADGPTEKADGYKEIPPAKGRARERLGVKRHKFDVYNESKKRFVSG